MQRRDSELDATQLIEYFLPLVSEAGPITNLVIEDDLFTDEPQIPYYRCDVAMGSRSNSSNLAAGGRDQRDLSLARVKALFEGFERFCGSTYNPEKLIWSAYDNLLKAGCCALDPATIVSRSIEGELSGRLRRETVSWVQARDELTDERVLVPAQLVFVPYDYGSNEPQLRDPITTGTAAGLSMNAALSRAKLEVIERDAVIIQHYAGDELSRCDEWLRGKSSNVLSLLLAAERYDLRIRLYGLRAELPTVIACLDDPTHIGPAIVVGSSTYFDWGTAGASAILECLTFRRQLRRLIQRRGYTSNDRPHAKGIRSLEARALYWSFSQLDSLGYLGDRQETLPPATDFPDAAIRGSLVVDLTTRSVGACGATVVKVIAPDYQPMHMDEQSPTWTTRLLDRLRGCPKPLAHLASQPPHPFL